MTKPVIAPEHKLINRVLCMITDDEHEQLEAICKAKFRSKSFVIREAFRQYLSTQQSTN
jgi:predicted transcriptional regulator